MRQEIISDKAQDYVSRLYAENEYPTTHSDVELDVETAFADGAKWRIDSVWHDASESPRTGDRIIVIDEDYHIVDVGYFGNSDRIMDGHRWAYINDLLPERKEEAK